MLVLIMCLVALLLSLPWLASGEGWVRTALTAWGLALTTAAMLGAWFLLVAPGTLSYISPYFDGGIAALLQFVRGSGGIRVLFTASLSPWWEQKSAYLVTVLELCVAVGGLFLVRALTPELLAASAWFSASLGPGNNIIADRDTGLIFGSFGLQDMTQASAGFPVWDLYLDKPGTPITPPYLLAELSMTDDLYLVVDRRMATEVPQVRDYFAFGEPASLDTLHDGRPVFYGRLSKFNRIAWLVKIFQSDNYSIYHCELPAGAAGYDRRNLPASHGTLSAAA
jgi:hypothetical protein